MPDPITITGVATTLAELADVLTITDEDGDSHRCTLGDFIEANLEDDQLIADVLTLEPGAELVAGGGAAPEVTIRREA